MYCPFKEPPTATVLCKYSAFKRAPNSNCNVQVLFFQKGPDQGFVRSQWFLGGVGFLIILGVGFVYPTPTPEVQLDHFLQRSPKLRIPVEMIQFLMKLLLKQRIFAVYHDFH